MTIVSKILTENECYRVGRSIVPSGIMIHSTGCNQTQLSVYFRLFNSFHPGGRQTCVHAFIGRAPDGSIQTWQTLPWEMEGWHSGSGTAGNANRLGYIGIELCEDDLINAGYFGAVYREAVEICAMLVKQYDIPINKIICHAEGHALGIATNHADVNHWFPRFGLSMNQMREDVKITVEREKAAEAAAKMDNTPSMDAEDAVAWAVKEGIMRGDPDGNLRLHDPITREEAAIMLYRLHNM